MFYFDFINYFHLFLFLNYCQNSFLKHFYCQNHLDFVKQIKNLCFKGFLVKSGGMNLSDYLNEEVLAQNLFIHHFSFSTLCLIKNQIHCSLYFIDLSNFHLTLFTMIKLNLFIQDLCLIALHGFLCQIQLQQSCGCFVKCSFQIYFERNQINVKHLALNSLPKIFRCYSVLNFQQSSFSE